MNIATEIGTEKVLLDCKSLVVLMSFFCLVTKSMASTQTWMIILKTVLVMAVAVGQIFLTK